MSKQHTRDSVIAALLKFKSDYKRAPRGRDVDGSIRAAAMRIFGSFESALAAALNTPDPAIETLKDIQLLYKRTGTIPDTDALYKHKTTMSMSIGRFYGHICNALDKAIGRSFCSEILASMYALSPTGEVTTAELEGEMQKKGITIAKRAITVHLVALSEQHLVTMGKYDTVAWWRLTDAGRQRAASVSLPSKGRAGEGS